MSGEKSDNTAKKKGRGKFVLLILGILVIAIVGAAFGLGIIRLPECHPAIQEEVDWPPDEPGIYEEASHNRLRTLEKAGFSPPGTVALCNVEGAPAAQAIAYVPASPRFLVLDPDQTGWEYHVYHSVGLPGEGFFQSRVNAKTDGVFQGSRIDHTVQGKHGTLLLGIERNF